jgi:hypothetical protein
MAMLRWMNTDVQPLAEKPRKGTIEQILSVDEMELGLRFLLGERLGQGAEKMGKES